MARLSVQSTATQAASTTLAVGRLAGSAPADAPNHGLQPGQDEDRAHADAREGDAHGQAAPAHEPVGEEERLAGIAQAVGTTTDEHTERGIEMPWLAHQRG